MGLVILTDELAGHLDHLIMDVFDITVLLIFGLFLRVGKRDEVIDGFTVLGLLGELLNLLEIEWLVGELFGIIDGILPSVGSHFSWVGEIADCFLGSISGIGIEVTAWIIDVVCLMIDGHFQLFECVLQSILVFGILD